jgi:hypothetical protein
MNRRIVAIAAIAVIVVAVILSAVVVDRPQNVAVPASGKTSARDGAGFGVVGADRPMEVPLAPPAPSLAKEAMEVQAHSATPPEEAEGGTAASTRFAARSQSGVALPTQAQQAGTMLIRSGHATIEVDSVEVGIARVRRLAQETGALVANTTLHAGREQQRSASLELRVPSDRFDAVVNGLNPIGRVESVNVSAQDVGEEFVDLTARLANARRLVPAD